MWRDCYEFILHFQFSVKFIAVLVFLCQKMGLGMEGLGRKLGYGLDSLVRVCVASVWSVGF